MNKKPSTLRHERFLEQVKNLNMEFPGAEIAEKTGYGESTISTYLNSKKEVSEKFYKSFLEAFSIKDDNFTGTEADDTAYKTGRKEVNPQTKKALLKKLLGGFGDIYDVLMTDEGQRPEIDAELEKEMLLLQEIQTRVIKKLLDENTGDNNG